MVEPADAIGQEHIAACCGMSNAGNLRIIHSGVNIDGATVASSGSKICHVWLLRGDIIIAVSLEGQTSTYVIAYDGSVSAADINLFGYDEYAVTLCCCDLGDAAVQITHCGAFRFEAAVHASHNSSDGRAWRPYSGRITSAAGNGGDSLVVALSDGKLVCNHWTD